MIGLIFSPVKLKVKDEDFTYVTTVTEGDYSGRHVYINPYYVERFCKPVISEGMPLDSFIHIYKNEIEVNNKNIEEVSSNWISGEATRIYSIADASDFQSAYDLSGYDSILSHFKEYLTESGDTLTSKIVLAGMDIILDYEKRERENAK